MSRPDPMSGARGYPDRKEDQERCFPLPSGRVIVSRSDWRDYDGPFSHARHLPPRPVEPWEIPAPDIGPGSPAWGWWEIPRPFVIPA